MNAKRLPIMKHVLIAFFLIAACTAQWAAAEVVMFKSLPEPANPSHTPFGFTGEAAGFGQDHTHWNPGFRTAVSGNHAFVVGWTPDDGFISKLDSSGETLWTKHMREIMGLGSYRWRINDIAISGGVIYICGDRYDPVWEGLSRTRGFVASLTLDGQPIEFTLVESYGHSAARARLNAIEVTTVEGVPYVFVTGDARGDSVSIFPRRHTNPSSSATFTNLVMAHVYGSFTNGDNALILRLDTDLNPNWGTTLGFPWSHNHGTAIAADGTGRIFVALKFENPDRHLAARQWELNRQAQNIRKTVTAENLSGTLHQNHSWWQDIDFHPGSWSMVLQLDTGSGNAATPIRAHFVPNPHYSAYQGSPNLITGLKYHGGNLYVGGHFKKYLQPRAYPYETSFIATSKMAESAYTYDIFVARLNPVNLHWLNFRLLQASGNSFLNQLVTYDNSVFVAGVAGAGMEHSSASSSNGTILNDGGSLGGASTPHLFWARLDGNDLTPAWRMSPMEGGDGASIPGLQRYSGIAVLGNRMIVVGSWQGGPITMGDNSSNRVTLPERSGSQHGGFAGFLETDGSWLTAVQVTIQSAYGNPTPHVGTHAALAGESITVSVPAEIYEDAQGNIIDAQNATAIRERAVTRRICIGYQFEDTDINGTVSTVTFTARGNTKLTFLWRTEHAIEVDSDIADSDGLTSTAAGNPQPEVQKHWIRENEQFTAFIDGSESTLEMPGTRWRSTGYVAYGSIAVAAGVQNGQFVSWASYQDRQQTPKITVGGPGRIVYRWDKQYRFTVDVNTTAATSAPRTYSDRPVPSLQMEPDWPTQPGFLFHFNEFPVEPLRLRVRSKPGMSRVHFHNHLMQSDGILAYFPMDEGSGSEVRDIINGSSATFQSDHSGRIVPLWQDDSPALSYADGDHFRVDDPSIGEGVSQAITITARIFLSSTAHGLQSIVCKGETKLKYGLLVGRHGQSYRLRFFGNYLTPPGGSGSIDATGSQLMAIGMWHDVAITYDGTHVQFYVNGVPDSPIHLPNVTFGNLPDEPLLIGADPPGATEYFDGRISRVGVYNRALTAAEIAQHRDFGGILEVRGATMSGAWEHHATIEMPALSESHAVTIEIPSGNRFRNRWLVTSPDSAHDLGFDICEIERVGFDPAHPPTAPHVRTGAREMWFEPGSLVTASALESISSGSVVLQLNGYTGAQGSITPYEQSGVTALSFVIDEPTRLTWDYARKIHHETVAVGGVLTYATVTGSDAVHINTSIAPKGGRILNAPEGSSWGDMARWDAVAQKVHVLRPGVFTVEFENTASPDNAAHNVIIQVTANWPAHPDYTHILEAPPVNLDPSASDATAFIELAYSEGRAGVSGNHFTSPESGRSVLVFSHRAGGVATGNLTRESLSVKVVDSLNWVDSAGGGLTNVTIGQPITDAGHDMASVGHNGYMLTPQAPVNVMAYDVDTLQGPLFAVNERLPVHDGLARPTDRELAIAWYRVQDGIRWPFKAIKYNPQWPAQTDRIVIASRLGSEGVKRTSRTAPGHYMHVYSTDWTSWPTWRRPQLDMMSVTDTLTPYQVIEWQPGAFPASLEHATAFFVFVYRGEFDPDKPLRNLIAAQANAPAPWLAIATVEEADRYFLVFTSQGADPQGAWGGVRSTAANSQSTDFLWMQPHYEIPRFRDPIVYHQPDPNRRGFNPNEEHARVAPSFLDPSRPAVFAMRRDLNRTTQNADFTSQPYVLVQYTDQSDAENPVTRMRVYRVEEEDATVVDTRLPAFNRAYTYFYPATAGRRLVPPYPLDLVMGGRGFPDEIDAIDLAGRKVFYKDNNGMPWALSGDDDGAADVRVGWFYDLPADFWHPTQAVGEPVGFAREPEALPGPVQYDTNWPDPVATIKAGETVTFAGGEYAMDRAGDAVPPPGLPQATAWQAARVVYDSANPLMLPGNIANNYLARAVQALEPREVDLPLSEVPADLQPASGNVIVEGLLWRFKDLPASLQQRIYYNTATSKLGVRGLLNGRVLGDSDLLVAPGAQTILQPNVLTAADEAIVKGLSGAGAWLQAVNALAAQSRNPANAPGVSGTAIGLAADPDAPAQVANATVYGPGVAVITHPALQNPATAGALPAGYITIVENDDPDLGTPVAMHVLRVSREKYRGSIAVLQPGNVFDEKLSLQHTADFAGNVGDLYFEWFYREEDGRDLNPPGVSLPTHGTPLPGDWIPFAEGVGLNTIQMAGAGPQLITDNLFFARYRHKDDGASPDWSAYAGAANSREPDPASPSAETDTAYIPQLAPGWIKRVTAAVNLFDARIRDFGNHGIPATYTSMLQIGGQRHEGPVAFNPDKDAIESVGLIELYQTVLNRAEDMTIVDSPGTDGVNTALLNAANRIAGLYTLFGNEAYADALDPTIGYSTVGYDSVAGQFGSLHPTVHAFQNMVPNLLEEELALLRGRAEFGARPVYNRLMWNFVNGVGQAAYVMNYAITDLDNDGFITEADARRLYPQGHGDAWGHYTMALKGYYRLAGMANFTWSARSEKYAIDGVVVDIDYLDERAFAQTASLRAQVGAKKVDLTYRKHYTENPAGQWQGYRDVDSDRAWGVFETAQRAGTAAYFDWLMANALLPAEETDPLKTGIRHVDRTTVPELGAIAMQATRIQVAMDKADRGLNPNGLDPNTVPFDIDPALVTQSGGSHFEQIYHRAVGAINNAAAAYSYANDIRNELRRTAATSEQLRQRAEDQDLALRNQMIQIFGTPYTGMIGPGKAYPTGYKGPDLYLYAYVDRLSVSAPYISDLKETTFRTTIVPGLRNLSDQLNPFDSNSQPVHNELRTIVSNYFHPDLVLPHTDSGQVSLELPRRASGYGFVAPPEWGQRAHPGEFQAAMQDLVQAEWRVRMALLTYEGQVDDFMNLLKEFELKSGIAADSLTIAKQAKDSHDRSADRAYRAFITGNKLNHIREVTHLLGQAAAEFIPEVLGLAASGGSPAKGGILALFAVIDGVFRATIGEQEARQYRAELEMEKAMRELDIGLLTLQRRSEIVDMLAEINKMVNSEPEARAAVFDAVQTMRAASDRVRHVLGRGMALLEERIAFNTRVASTTSLQRYQDFTFRVFHNEAIRKYESAFELAQRYAYLAAKAYAYELNLPEGHPAHPQPVLSALLRERSLGILDPQQAHLPGPGLSGLLAELKVNFDSLKSQMGLLDPTHEVYTFSLRTGLNRIGMSSRVRADWQNALEDYRVEDLWNHEFIHDGINHGYIFRRFCRPFIAESAGPQAALVIPFASTIHAGKNWFGHELAGGDSAFNSTYYSTKIRSVGVRLRGYNNTELSQTPHVYLVPVGMDRMFHPHSPVLDYRSWNVVDQRIPAPLSVGVRQLSDPDWQPFTGSTNGFFEEIRKFSSFRAYHDAGGWSTADMLVNSRHIGRSVWNTQWVLIIPSVSLRSDSGNSQSGIDTLIYGAPLDGFNQQTAGTVNRDQMGVHDIELLIQAYSFSGN